MEPVPILGRPMSDFAVTAQAASLGFRGYSLFPHDMPMRTCAVLGLGVLTHMGMQYPALSPWFDTEWKANRVELLLSYLFENTREDGSHNTDPAFWRGLSYKVFEVAEDLCVRFNCSHLFYAASSKGDLTLDVHDPLLRMVCDHLCLDLIVLKNSKLGFVQGDTRNDGRIGLPLVVAEESQAVMVMYHERFYDADVDNYSGFPFFIEMHESVPLFSGFQPAKVDYSQAIQQTTDTLAVAVSVIRTVAEHTSATQHLSLLLDLQRNYSKYANTLRLFNHPIPDMVQSLRCLSPPHPHEHCGEHPLGGEFFTLPECTHSLHTECLRDYLTQSMENVILGYSESLTCPLCPVPMSDATLCRFDPTIYSNYKQKLERTKRRSQMFGNTVVCQACNERVSIEESLYHRAEGRSHSVCVRCLAGAKKCAVCKVEFNDEEKAWVKQAAHFTRSHQE